MPRQGAVLVLLYPDGDDLHLPLTVRSDRLPSHRGEVSLPGGAIDPDDAGVEAALRECYEELGVDPGGIQVWGTLSSFYIQPSNFQDHAGGGRLCRTGANTAAKRCRGQLGIHNQRARAARPGDSCGRAVERRVLM